MTRVVNPDFVAVKSRLSELDGLRGWAALWVVVFHFGWELFGVRFPVFRNPVAAAFNGSLAVTVFFVLSGEALSAGFFSGRGLSQIIALAIKRLPRLTIPAFFAVLVTYLVARLGFTQQLQAAAGITGRQDWLGMMHPEAISLKSLIKFPLIDMYVSAGPNFEVIPFLWTMNIEMVGSLLVFVLLMCWSRVHHFAKVVLVFALVLLLNKTSAYLADFCFGIIIAQWRYRGLITAWGERRGVDVGAIASVVVVLALSSVAALNDLDERMAPLLAPVFVVAVSLSPHARRFLSISLSQMLGKISFPLYLVHYAIMVSLTTAMISAVFKHGYLDQKAAFGIIVASTVFALVCARVFLPVERLTKWVGYVIGRSLIGESERNLEPR